MLELLPRLARITRPRLIVDLGAGTGLSTRFWADVADDVVGVEPNQAMRRFAEQATAAPNVRYVGTSSYDTGLPRASADVVTAAQSLQWMRRHDLFSEIARILRKGGALCAYTVLVTPVWRTLLDAGASESDVGLDRLRHVAAAMPEVVPWWIGYRAWIGLK